VHPEIINCYLEGTLVKTLKQKIRKEPRDDIAALRPEEAATLVLLQTRLDKSSRTAA
jgi:DNA topoisomerase-1